MNIHRKSGSAHPSSGFWGLEMNWEGKKQQIRTKCFQSGQCLGISSNSQF